MSQTVGTYPIDAACENGNAFQTGAAGARIECGNLASSYDEPSAKSRFTVTARVFSDEPRNQIARQQGTDFGDQVEAFLFVDQKMPGSDNPIRQVEVIRQYIHVEQFMTQRN